MPKTPETKRVGTLRRKFFSSWVTEKTAHVIGLNWPDASVVLTDGTRVYSGRVPVLDPRLSEFELNVIITEKVVNRKDGRRIIWHFGTFQGKDISERVSGEVLAYFQEVDKIRRRHPIRGRDLEGLIKDTVKSLRPDLRH